MAVLSNSKHEKFCNERMSGKSGAAAYRAAYGSDVGGADQAASRLLKRDDIGARLAELQSETAERNEVTVDSLVRDYQRIYDESMKDPKTYPAAVNAKNSIAKITGIWLDKVQVSTESIGFEALTTPRAFRRVVCGGCHRRAAMSRTAPIAEAGLVWSPHRPIAWDNPSSVSPNCRQRDARMAASFRSASSSLPTLSVEMKSSPGRPTR